MIQVHPKYSSQSMLLHCLKLEPVHTKYFEKAHTARNVWPLKMVFCNSHLVFRYGESMAQGTSIGSLPSFRVNLFTFLKIEWERRIESKSLTDSPKLNKSPQGYAYPLSEFLGIPRHFSSWLLGTEPFCQNKLSQTSGRNCLALK